MTTSPTRSTVGAAPDHATPHGRRTSRPPGHRAHKQHGRQNPGASCPTQPPGTARTVRSRGRSPRSPSQQRSAVSSSVSTRPSSTAPSTRSRASSASPTAASGFAVASALIGCAFGAYFAGRLADRCGRTRVMFWAAVLFLVELDRLRLRVRHVGPRPLAPRRRSRHRYRLGHRAGVHLRGLPEGDPRAAGLVPAARDHARYLRRAAVRPALRRDRGRRLARSSSGLPAWRWMFLVGVIPSVVYGILAITLPESPRYLLAEGPERGRPRGHDARSSRARPSTRAWRRSRTASRRKPTRRRAPSGATASACSRSSGSASSWPCCSSSSAST